MHFKQFTAFIHKRLKIFVALLAILSGLSLFANQSSTVYAADAKSMEDISSHYADAGGAWLANSDSDKKSQEHYDEIDKASVGRMWNFFGYGSDSPILGQSAKGTRASTYNALNQLGSSANANKDNNFTHAAKFSYAMNASGLDHQYTNDVGLGTKIFRYIGAIITILAVSFAGLAETVLKFSTSLLKWLNPFSALRYLVTSNDNAAGVTGNSFFKPLISTLRPIYQSVSSITISFAVLAVAVGVLLALTGFVNTKKGIQRNDPFSNLGRVFGKFFVRIFVIFGAPLFIGALSDALLNDLSISTDVTNNIAAREVYSNYVDFSNWAQNSRLALPSPSGKSIQDSSSSAGNKLTPSGQNVFSEDYILAINSDGAVDKDAQNAAKVEVRDTTKKGKPIKPEKATASLSTVGSLVNMLWNRYAASDTINGTDWNSNVKSQLMVLEDQKGLTKGAHTGKLAGLTSTVGDFFGGMWDKVTGKGNKKHNSATKDRKNPFAAVSDDQFGDYGNGGDYDKAMENYLYKDYTMKYKGGYYQSAAPTGSSHGIGSTKGVGLSTIGLYNYLNIKAEPTKLTYTKPSSFMGLSSINSHASVGFVGRGLLFFGTYVRMVVMIATAGLLILFVVIVILKGILQGAPRILYYIARLGSGSWQGFLGVFKELIGIYARVIVGMLIVYVGQAALGSLSSGLDDLVINGTSPSTAISFLNMSKVSIMPYATSFWVVGAVRLLESVIIGFVSYVMGRNFWDLLRLLDQTITRLINTIAGTHAGKAMMTPPKSDVKAANASNSGSNSNNNNQDTNNGFNSDENTDDPSVQDGADPDDPNNLFGKHNDADENLLGDEKPQSGLLSGLQSGAAAKTLGAISGISGSKGLQMAENAASAVGRAIGGSPLGRALGLKSRGQGQTKAEDAMASAKQTAAEAADPKRANTSAKAGVGKSHGQQFKNNEDARTQNGYKKAAADAGKDAEKFQKGILKDAKQAANAKDPAKAQELAKKLQSNKSLAPKQAKNQLKQAGENAHKKAAKEQQSLQDQAKEAKQAARANKAQLAQAKQQYSQAKRKDPKMAQKIKELQAAQPMLDTRANQLAAVADSAKAMQLTSITGRDTGAHGEHVRQLTPEQLQQAKDRQFVNQTGMDAASATKANAKTMDKVAKDTAAAKDVLASPYSTEEQRQQARQILSEAQTVQDTGYQYGRFQDDDAPALKQASSQDSHEASHNAVLDKAAIATGGLTVDQDAPLVTPSEKRYADRVTKAQKVLDTGMATADDGSTHVASLAEREQAQKTLDAAPEHQIHNIQNGMMAASLEVAQGADQAANRAVANMPRNATQQDLEQAREDARNDYYGQESVQRKLASAGLISQTVATAEATSPDAVKTARQQVQSARDFTRTTQAAVSASLAPYRAVAEGTHNGKTSGDIIKSYASKTFNDLPASAELVDKAHYVDTATDKKHVTSNGQIIDALTDLTNSYSTYTKIPQTRDNKAKIAAAAKKVTTARQKAESIGLSSDIIYSYNKSTQWRNKLQTKSSTFVSNAMAMNDKQNVVVPHDDVYMKGEL